MNESNGPGNAYHGSPSRIAFAPQPRDRRTTLAATPIAGTKRECNIVIGNHARYVGITEILYTLHTFFAGRYRTSVSLAPIPDQLNVIIDEFSIPALVEYLAAMKQTHPDTRFVVLATEFVTEISSLASKFGKTFDSFSPQDDVRHLLSLLAHRLHLRSTPPYLHARYQGFVQALPLADLVLCAHPGIARSMQALPAGAGTLPIPPLTLYPQIDCDRLADDRRLYRLPAGFVMTGTLTPFRKRVASEMIRAFGKVGVHMPFYRHVPFDQSSGPQLGDHEVDLGYDEGPHAGNPSSHGRDTAGNYLYNLNPPQRPHWSFSSPMRILRAILLGQIPVVTEKFADHDIESIALLWDGSTDTAAKLWIDATMGRPDLVERHLNAVASYDRVARAMNAPIDAALAKLA